VKFRGLGVVESGLWRLLSWGLGGVLLRGILSAALGMRRREIVRVFEAVKCPSHIIGWSRDGSSPGLYNHRVESGQAGLFPFFARSMYLVVMLLILKWIKNVSCVHH
jgi:hypothetical protein